MGYHEPDNTEARALYIASPGGVRTTQAFSQSKEWPNLDVNRESGCIHSVQHAYSQDGGLAVLYGNIAERGCVVENSRR